MAQPGREKPRPPWVWLLMSRIIHPDAGDDLVQAPHLVVGERTLPTTAAGAITRTVIANRMMLEMVRR